MTKTYALDELIEAWRQLAVDAFDDGDGTFVVRMPASMLDALLQHLNMTLRITGDPKLSALIEKLEQESVIARRMES